MFDEAMGDHHNWKTVLIELVFCSTLCSQIISKINTCIFRILHVEQHRKLGNVTSQHRFNVLTQCT